MEIYQMEADLDLMMVRSSNQEDARKLVSPKLRLGQEAWPSNSHIHLAASGWDGPQAWVPADLAYCDHLPPLCLSQFAQSALRPFWRNQGYLVDTNLNVNGLYRLLFLTRRLDAFDLTRSDFTTFDDGNVWEVTRFELRREQLEGHHIFLLNDRLSMPFVSGKFVGEVGRSKLLGFEFTKIWSSETGGVQLNPLKPWNPKSKAQQKADRVFKQKGARDILAARSNPDIP